MTSLLHCPSLTFVTSINPISNPHPLTPAASVYLSIHLHLSTSTLMAPAGQSPPSHPSPHRTNYKHTFPPSVFSPIITSAPTPDTINTTPQPHHPDCHPGSTGLPHRQLPNLTNLSPTSSQLFSLSLLLPNTTPLNSGFDSSNPIHQYQL